MAHSLEELLRAVDDGEARLPTREGFHQACLTLATSVPAVAARDAVAGSLQELEHAIEELTAGIQSVGAESDHTLRTAESKADALVTEVEQAIHALHELPSRLDTARSDLEDVFTGKIDDLLAHAEDQKAALLGDFEEKLETAVGDALAHFHAELDGLVSERLEHLEEVVTRLKDHLAHDIEEFRHHVTEDLEQALRTEARDLLESSMHAAEKEILNGVLSSEMNVQLNVTLAPIMPELIALRILAPEIKRLLQIARMGL